MILVQQIWKKTFQTCLTNAAAKVTLPYICNQTNSYETFLRLSEKKVYKVPSEIRLQWESSMSKPVRDMNIKYL